MAAARGLRALLEELLEVRRKVPGDDLLSDLAAAEVSGDRLDREAILDIVVHLVAAGNETTFRGIGSVMYSLLRHPDQLALVQADPGLVPAAIEETLRWEPPLPFLARTVGRPAVLGGYQVEPGDILMLAIASANRDEAYYTEPDAFRVDRDSPKPHITFAVGPHICLGLHLARIEMNSSVRILLERLVDIELDPAEPDAHIRGAFVRGPNRVPIAFRPGSRKNPR